MTFNISHLVNRCLWPTSVLMRLAAGFVSADDVLKLLRMTDTVCYLMTVTVVIV